MRILIYIEPFPLHQTMDHHKGAAAAFARMLVSETSAHHLREFDIRLYSNRETLAYAQEQALAAKRFFLNPESRELDQFRTSLTEWPNQGVKTWTNLLTGTGDVTYKYQRIFEQVFSRFAFDMVVTLGDNGAAKAFAASANLDHMVLDASFASPSLFNATVFDPSGTGGFALLSQVNITTVKSMVGKDSWTALTDQSHLSLPESGHQRPDSLGPIDFTGQDRILRRGSARAALVCLQNFDDPLFCAHSKFQSPSELVDACLSELSDTETITIVRPPRGGSEGIGQAEAIGHAKKTAERYGDRVIWLDRQSERTSDARLFTLCDLVITANDAAGLEATFYDKPVCVLGGASYKPIGAFPKLSAVLARQFDPRSYLKNLAALRAYMMRSRLVDQKSSLTFDVFADRLAQTLHAWRENEANPKRTLEDLYSRYAPRTTEQLKLHLGKPPGDPAPAKLPKEQSNVDERAAKGYLWNASVSDLTSRARRTLGLKMFQSGLTTEPGGGALASIPLFAPETTGLQIPPGSLPDHPLTADELRTVEAAKKALQALRKSRSTFAIIAHCFYQDTTEFMMERLKAAEQRFDLYVTLPELGSAPLKAVVREAFPTAKIVTLPNRGRDVWPFCFVLSELDTDKYDCVLKLHTIKPHFEDQAIDSEVGGAWQDYALMCLLGDNADSPRTDDLLEPEDTWSIAAPEGMLSSTKGQTLNLNLDVTKALEGLDHDRVPHHWLYAEGGMYWVNMNAIKHLPKSFSKPEHYAAGAFNTSCEMRNLAKYAIALTAYQSGSGACTVTPDDAFPTFNAKQSATTASEAIRAYLRASSSD